MYTGFIIEPPFFEIGPKAYIYGKKALALAKEADTASHRYGVRIIFTPQTVDIPAIARETKHIMIFAQHMDSLEPGKGAGSVLPEALKAAGASGVMLNHAEKRLTLSEIRKTIQRADTVGLATLVCADTPEEAAAIAQLRPNIILAEPPVLIGSAGSTASDSRKIGDINKLIRSICPDIHIMHSAGIQSGKDVFDIVKMGAEATGSSSGIILAENPGRMLDEMVRAMREAWDEIHVQERKEHVSFS